MKLFKVMLLFLLCISCKESQEDKRILKEPIAKTSLVVLGTVQDGGSPHIACKKDCCKELFLNPDKDRKVVSLGLVDAEHHKTFLFEATPNITEQVKMLKGRASIDGKEIPDGVFLTHAHIGHYGGLMYFGKEAANTVNVPVYVMPKMKAYLEQNGPWGQLAANHNISLRLLEHKKEVSLTPNISVVPFTVPHRDEYSETVGFTIIGANKKVLFIPDIDKWERWETNVIQAISEVDYAFLDATFYNKEEIKNRDMSEIPHPFVVESMERFIGLPESEKSKIHFIHFNHTNPLLNPESKQAQEVFSTGFNIAKIRQIFEL